jgi:hypothetical protein
MAYIGKQPLVGNFTLLDALTASATDTYALTKDSVAVFPQTPANCIVSLNGVIQAPTDSYTISGSNIVFASALTASDSIDFITVLGDVLNIGTPSDNTVSLAKLTATGTKDATTFLRGDNTFASASGKFESQLLHVRDEKTLADGGTPATSYTKRDLNTVVTNEISGASLSSSVITLPSGTYYIQASAPARSVNEFKSKFVNTTDSTDVVIGTSGYCATATSTNAFSFVTGRFTIASSKNFELQFTVQNNAIGNSGLGVGCGHTTEVYADVQIWKIA